MVSELRGKFVRVVCPRCKNNQVVFGKCTTVVKCTKCNKLLVKNTGGKTRIRAVVRKVFVWN